MPVSYRMPAAERDQLMALAEPAAVLSGAQDLKGITRAQMRALEPYPRRHRRMRCRPLALTPSRTANGCCAGT
jgi:hypothetical protein